MTLEDLKTKSEQIRFQYAYGQFKKPVKPPHLVAIVVATDNFMADNKVYQKRTPIKLDYTYIDKDIEMQNKIEDEILSNIAWNKTDETYLSDEEVWQVSYFFEI